MNCNKVSEPSSFRKAEILDVLNSFYKKPENFLMLEKILRKKERLSLRTLEFACSHSHKFHRDLKLHGSYQNYLDSCGKRYFDAFRRHSRFKYTLGDKSVETNVAQLRFLKFALQNGIVDWLLKRQNIALVEDAMKKHLKKRRAGKKRKKILAPSFAEEDVELKSV